MEIPRVEANLEINKYSSMINLYVETANIFLYCQGGF